MISKAKLKELAVYKQQKRCDEESVFVAEGVKICDEILAANLPIKVLCATNLWFSKHNFSPDNDTFFEVDVAALERLSGMKTPNEVWMLLDRNAISRCERDHNLDRNAISRCEQDISNSKDSSRHSSQFSILNSQLKLTIALDHLQDPGNLGTIIRTADWFGIRHIICSEGCVSCFNPKVVQSTMGGLLRTKIEYCDLPQYLARCGKPVFGAVLNGENIWEQPLGMPEEGAVLVIGNESRGITPEVQACVTHRISIPNLGGTAESLNASVACAILCAELVKKRLKA